MFVKRGAGGSSTTRLQVLLVVSTCQYGPFPMVEKFSERLMRQNDQVGHSEDVSSFILTGI
jgi:hypothetical protein